jgi:hypothetical protein
MEIEMDRERATTRGRIDPTSDEALRIGNGNLNVVNFMYFGA